MVLPVIQSLWIGNDLTNMEKLCIQSFLDHGHKFHLYTYADIGGIPAGATIKDANEILPESAIFQYKGGSYAGFANWFRYAMLAKLGGFWVDMDMVCLRPFDFDTDVVLVGEVGLEYATAAIGAPVNHPLMVALEEFCRTFPNKEGSTFGAVGGPTVFTRFIHQMQMERHTTRFWQFHPFLHTSWQCGYNPYFNDSDALLRNCYAVHFFNDMLHGRTGVDKNACFDERSLFEQLKMKHGIATDSTPIITNQHLEEIVKSKKQVQRKKHKRRQKREWTLYLLAAFVAGLAVGWIF